MNHETVDNDMDSLNERLELRGSTRHAGIKLGTFVLSIFRDVFVTKHVLFRWRLLEDSVLMCDEDFAVTLTIGQTRGTLLVLLKTALDEIFIKNKFSRHDVIHFTIETFPYHHMSHDVLFAQLEPWTAVYITAKCVCIVCT
jgi:hypothetical protein